MNEAVIADCLQPLFLKGGRFHGLYEPPQEASIEALVDGLVWQVPVFPPGSVAARLLRVYRFDADPEGLLAAHWRNETRALLRLSSRRHPALPILRDAALLADRALGYVIIDDPGFPVIDGHPVLESLQTDRVAALKAFFSLVEALSLLHAEGMVHRSLTPNAVCARRTADAPIVIDGFQMSAFVANWLRGRGALKEVAGAIFLPRSPAAQVILPPERLGPLLGGETKQLEGYGTDVFSLGMLAIHWFAGPDDSSDVDAVVAGGRYSEDAHRRVVERAHQRLTAAKLPSQLRRLLFEMTSFMPSGRIPSAGEVYESLARAYGTLLAQMELEAAPATTEPLILFYLEESLQRIYQHGYGNSHPTSPNLAEYSSFIERDLSQAVLTWNPLGPPWETDDPRPTHIALLGEHYAYLCQYLNQDRDGEDRRVVMVKFMVPAGHAMARELRRQPRQRSLPPTRAFFHQEGGRQRPVTSTVSWQPLVESVRAPDVSERVTPVEAATEWLLRIFNADLRAHEYAFERVDDPGALILRSVSDVEVDNDVADDLAPFVSLFEKAGAIEPMGRHFKRAVERDAEDDKITGFVVRGPSEPDLSVRLEFDQMLDDYSVRFRSIEDPSIIPDRGFVRVDDRGTRSLLRRQRRAVRALLQNHELVAQLQSPHAAEIFGAGDFPNAGADLQEPARALLRTILRSWPLYVLQGPPGTGKTFVAAHLIKEALREDPAARLLVSAQSHHALDNILEEVEKLVGEESTGTSPLLLRIASKNTEPKVGALAQRHLHRETLLRVRGAIAEGPASSQNGALARIQKQWRKLAKNQQLDVELIQRLYRAASVVFATCAAAGSNGFENLDDVGSFDWVIIEEAARAWLTEVAVPLIQGNRWLLIGDQAQLAAFRHGEVDRLLRKDISESITAAATELPASEALEPFLLYFKNLMERPPDASRAIDPRSTLLEQRRMHPDIGGLVSFAFYGDRLKSHPETKRAHGVRSPDYLKDTALAWIDTSAFGHAAFENGRVNMCEAQLLRYVVRAVDRFPAHDKNIPAVCVLTPYLKQLGLLREQVKDLPEDSFHSVDSFQGRQAEIVFVSLARNNAYEDAWSALGFLQDPERANVMFSRARRLLVIVGSLKHFARFPDTHWGRVTEYMKRKPNYLVDAASTVGFRWNATPPPRSPR
jgi:hypothetical protein